MEASVNYYRECQIVGASSVEIELHDRPNDRLVAAGGGWRCLAFLTRMPGWLFVRFRRPVGALRNQLFRPGRWGGWLCRGGTARDWV
jgi:hypothetical protein